MHKLETKIFFGCRKKFLTQKCVANEKSLEDYSIVGCLVWNMRFMHHKQNSLKLIYSCSFCQNEVIRFLHLAKWSYYERGNNNNRMIWKMQIHIKW